MKSGDQMSEIDMSGYEKRTFEKKRKVMDATFDLLNTDIGIKGLTMEEIAEKSKVSKTSIFKYFGDKDTLINEVYKDYLDKIGNETQAIIDQNLPFEDTLITMTQNELEHLRKVNKQFYLDMMAFVTERNDEGLTVIMREYSNKSFSIMLDIFHRGRKEGKVDLKYSDEFLLVFFQAMIEGISSPQIYNRILPYTMEWTELLIKGVAPKK